jgi:hypothetical protein
MKPTLSKVFSAIYDSLSRRSFKVAQYDAKSADEVAPFGVDGNPLRGMDAIYMETATDDQPVIIGYLNTKQLARPGELRLFSKKTDTSRAVAAYIWLHTDGTIELAGNADNAVRYTPLNTGLQQQVTALNIELQKIQVAITALGGSYLKQDVSLDISGSKIEEIKTI